MTRKHFVAIAAALADERPRRESFEDVNVAQEERTFALVNAQWRHDVRAIARTLQSFNDAFDYGRFIAATEK